MLQQRDDRLAHQVKVASAGLITKKDVEWMHGFGLPICSPAFGRPPYRSLIPVMLKRGIDLSAYRSKGLKRPMVEEADLIVVFDEYPPFRKAAILSFWPQAKEKVFTFREFVEDIWRRRWPNFFTTCNKAEDDYLRYRRLNIKSKICSVALFFCTMAVTGRHCTKKVFCGNERSQSTAHSISWGQP